MPESSEYPEEGEFVLGTVKEIFNQGAFISLDEYGGKNGMLHISEMSLKWVRNIRDYVREGQKVVLQVLKTNPSKGHVDLSLRRVSDAQRKIKLQQVKQEQRVAKIIEMVSEQASIDKNNLRGDIESKISSDYASTYDFFEAVSSDAKNAEKLKLPKKTLDTLIDVVGKSIKPAFVEVTGYVELINYSKDGVEEIKKAFESIESKDDEVKATYISAPLYRLKVKSDDYKKAEKTLKAAAEQCIQYNNGHGGEGVFRREMPK